MNFKQLFKNKTFRIVAILVCALILLILVWTVFFGGGSKSSAYTATAEEERLARLLSEIEGIEESTVMITEREGVPVRAVIVFRGKDGILIRTRIMEVAAAALALSTGDIVVYPAGS